jgi:hypothetical protein
VLLVDMVFETREKAGNHNRASQVCVRVGHPNTTPLADCGCWSAVGKITDFQVGTRHKTRSWLIWEDEWIFSYAIELRYSLHGMQSLSARELWIEK